MKPCNRQTAFSIIEMILVIIVLTIIAVTALTKFLEASEEATENTRKMVIAAFNVSLRDVRTMWIMDGRPSAASNNRGAQVTINEETTVTIDDNYGYPVGSRGRDRVNNFSVRDCEDVFNDLVVHDFTTARRGQVNNTTFVNFDIIVSRQNGAPDICHYTWSSSTDSRPANAAPTRGTGFSYNPVTGLVSAFDFT